MKTHLPPFFELVIITAGYLYYQNYEKQYRLSLFSTFIVALVS
jgi:hypothetical protein